MDAQHTSNNTPRSRDCVSHLSCAPLAHRLPPSQTGDAAISHLLAAGLVCRDTQDLQLLHWTLPQVGAVVNAIAAGHKVGASHTGIQCRGLFVVCHARTPPTLHVVTILVSLMCVCCVCAVCCVSCVSMHDYLYCCCLFVIRSTCLRRVWHPFRLLATVIPSSNTTMGKQNRAQFSQELVGALKRVRARALPLATLERRRIGQPLGSRFLLRHLCGSGVVAVTPTPTGPAVTLAARR